MVEGIHKLSGIMKDAAGISLILGPFTMFTWILVTWWWLQARSFDLSGIGIVPVVIVVLVLYLGLRLVDHGVRTYRFAKEWERRYEKLLALEETMASDLGITPEE